MDHPLTKYVCDHSGHFDEGCRGCPHAFPHLPAPSTRRDLTDCRIMENNPACNLDSWTCYGSHPESREEFGCLVRCVQIASLEEGGRRK